MRILHITTNYPTPEHPIFGIFVKEQKESLEALGIDCDVLYCDRKGRGTWMYFTYIPKIWWKVLRGRYDIIHCHHVLSALLFSMTLWPLFKKCVVSYQNDPSQEWIVNCFGLVHALFDKIIIKNTSVYLRQSKTVYLPNGCNEDYFVPMDRQECRHKLNLKDDAIYVLYMDSNHLGRPQKRKDRFMQTIEILKKDFPHIEAMELYNTPREKMPEYINSCDLHMISSDFEGSPNSVKECLCCNVPVVSTDVGNVREMIGDIPGCEVVSEFTPDALAEGVKKCLGRKDGFNGRDLFLAKGYGMGEVANKLKDLYEELL